MRQPRDFDAELNALSAKASALKSRKVRQLGELVIAAGADACPPNSLRVRCSVQQRQRMTQHGRSGACVALTSFGTRSGSREALAQVRSALRRAATARSRLLAARARHDMRKWIVKRRERTRQLIELGGLVTKAGLVELTGDDRAVIFGALLNVAAKLRSEERDQALLLWRRRGKRAFCRRSG